MRKHGDICATCNEHYLSICDHINVQMKETKKISFLIPRADDPDIIWSLRIHIGYRWMYYASLNVIIFLKRVFSWKIQEFWSSTKRKKSTGKRMIDKIFYDAGCPLSCVMITNRKDQQINRCRRRRRKTYYGSYKSVIEHYFSGNTLCRTWHLLLYDVIKNILKRLRYKNTFKAGGGKIFVELKI